MDILCFNLCQAFLQTKIVCLRNDNQHHRLFVLIKLLNATRAMKKGTKNNLYVSFMLLL